MTSTNSVQDTRISRQVRDLHSALLAIATIINRPQGDEALIREAGIPLDRALFPLLVGIERFGPIGIVDLADRAGRDHTTVSRQVAKLESLGLVSRQDADHDRRIKQAVVTANGKAMTDLVDGARERLGRKILGDWDPTEIDDLIRLLQKFADAAQSPSAEE